jgi:hypothetical protein
MNCALKIGLLSAVVQGAALCQPNLTISRKNISLDGSFLEMSLPAFKSRLSEIHPQRITDSGVKQALSETESMLRRATNFHPESNRGATTFVVRGYDCLLTEYEVSAVQSIKSIYVVDMTRDSVILVPFRSADVSSADEVRALVNRIIEWNAFPADLNVRLAFDPATVLLVGQGISNFSALRPRFDLRSFVIGSQSYLAWTCSKRFFPTVFAPEQIDLPERFPPLAERLRRRSTQDLSTMLLDPGVKSPFSRRDDLIIRELLQRGISAEEFTGILLPARADTTQIERRAESVAGAEDGFGKPSEFEALVRSALSGLDPASPRSDAAVRGLLRGLIGNAQVDLTKAVCELLRQKRFIKPALLYLAFRGHRTEDIDCVQSVDLDGQFENDRRLTLGQMQQSQEH